MTAKQLATVVFRVLGLAWLVESLTHLDGVGFLLAYGRSSALYRDQALYAWVLTIWPFFMVMVAGVIFLALAPQIAQRVVRGIPDEVVIKGWSLTEIQAIALSVVGAVIVVRSLPTVAACIGQIFYFRDQSPAPALNAPYLHAYWDLINNLVSTALGLALFFGARGLANLWHRLRTFGHPSGTIASAPPAR